MGPSLKHRGPGTCHPWEQLSGARFGVPAQWPSGTSPVPALPALTGRGSSRAAGSGSTVPSRACTLFLPPQGPPHPSQPHLWTQPVPVGGTLTPAPPQLLAHVRPQQCLACSRLVKASFLSPSTLPVPQNSLHTQASTTRRREVCILSARLRACGFPRWQTAVGSPP